MAARPPLDAHSRSGVGRTLQLWQRLSSPEPQPPPVRGPGGALGLLLLAALDVAGGLAIRLAICTGPRTTSPPEPPCGAPCNRCCIDGHTDSGRCPLFVAATSATRGPTMSDVAYATSKNASSFDAHSTGSRRLPECEYLCTRFECLQASVGNLVALVHHVVAKEVDVCLALVELLWREHARENRNT